MNDLKDYLDTLRDKGYDNEEKLKGMLTRANEIATKELGNDSDRGEYKAKVISIFQSFMHESVSRQFITKLL